MQGSLSGNFFFRSWTLCSIEEVYGRGKQPPLFCCLPFRPLQKCDSDRPISDGSSCSFSLPARDISAHLGRGQQCQLLRPGNLERKLDHTRNTLRPLPHPHRDPQGAAAAYPWQRIRPIFFLVWITFRLINGIPLREAPTLQWETWSVLTKVERREEAEDAFFPTHTIFGDFPPSICSQWRGWARMQVRRGGFSAQRVRFGKYCLAATQTCVCFPRRLFHILCTSPTDVLSIVLMQISPKSGCGMLKIVRMPVNVACLCARWSWWREPH